jgi:hypothetical protein
LPISARQPPPKITRSRVVACSSCPYWCRADHNATYGESGIPTASSSPGDKHPFLRLQHIDVGLGRNAVVTCAYCHQCLSGPAVTMAMMRPLHSTRNSEGVEGDGAIRSLKKLTQPFELPATDGSLLCHRVTL